MGTSCQPKVEAGPEARFPFALAYSAMSTFWNSCEPKGLIL
jgi:hypothetical protein